MGAEQSQIVEIDHKSTMIGDTAEKQRIENNRNEHIIEMEGIKREIRLDRRLEQLDRSLEGMGHSIKKSIRFSTIIMIIMLTFLVVMLTFFLITRKE